MKIGPFHYYVYVAFILKERFFSDDNLRKLLIFLFHFKNTTHGFIRAVYKMFLILYFYNAFGMFCRWTPLKMDRKDDTHFEVMLILI